MGAKDSILTLDAEGPTAPLRRQCLREKGREERASEDPTYQDLGSCVAVFPRLLGVWGLRERG